MSHRRVSFVLLGLCALSAGLGWLEQRPPGWLADDPLTHPLGLEFLKMQGVDSDPDDQPGETEDQGPVPTHVNRAGAVALQRLPGVGPVMAGRILALRDSLGPFPDAESLLEVKGIGPKTLARMRPFLLFEADSSATAAPGSAP